MTTIDKEAVAMMAALQEKKIPSHICVAYAVAMDNALMDDLSKEESMSAWLGMAADIDGIMQQMDGPRFMLYDYLDACVNGPRAWDVLAEDIHKAIASGSETAQDDIFAVIVNLAENKRQTYSGDFY